MYHEETEWQEYLALIKERPDDFRDGMLEIITDPQQVDAFVNETGRRLGILYRSRFSILVVDLVRNRMDSKGSMFAFERMLPTVRTGGIVSIPIFRGRMVLLKQFRHAHRGPMWNFPRGFGEPGIGVVENLKKELSEELDVGDIHDVRKLGVIAPDSGLTGTTAEVFSCSIDQMRLKKGYEEILEVQTVSENEFEQMIRDGEILDGFTLAAYSLMKAHTE